MLANTILSASFRVENGASLSITLKIRLIILDSLPRYGDVVVKEFVGEFLGMFPSPSPYLLPRSASSYDDC